MAFWFLLGLLAGFQVLPITAEESYFTCDGEIMGEYEYCVVIASEWCPDEYVPLEPHDVSIDVGETFYRCVADSDDENQPDACIAPNHMPAKPGYKMIGLDSNNEGEKVTGAEWQYTLHFDLIGPLRDLLFFEADRIVGDDGDKDVWYTYIQFIEDCSINVGAWRVGDENDMDDIFDLLYPTDDARVSSDINHFLEESELDLACLMTTVEDDPAPCQDIHAWNGIKLGQWSDCWYEGYKTIWGVYPEVDGMLTSSIWDQHLSYLEYNTFSITATIDTTIRCIAMQSSDNGYPTATQVNNFLNADAMVALATFENSVVPYVEMQFTFESDDLENGVEYEAYCATDTGVSSIVAEFTACDSETSSCDGSNDIDHLEARAEMLQQQDAANRQKNQMLQRQHKRLEVSRSKRSLKTLNPSNNATAKSWKKV